MSRLALTLALAAALTAGACGPPTEPRTTIAGSGGGPRVLFEDELRVARYWTAVRGTICRSSFADGGFVIENIAASPSTSCVLRPGHPEAYAPSVRIEVSARLRKGSREDAFGFVFGSRGSGDQLTFATMGLTSNGTYRVASWNGKWAYPVPATLSRSVKTDYGALNTLAVEVRDRSVVAYVNGRPVATAELSIETAGTIGLFVDQRGMEVVFSNLRVVELVPMR